MGNKKLYAVFIDENEDETIHGKTTTHIQKTTTILLDPIQTNAGTAILTAHIKADDEIVDEGKVTWIVDGKEIGNSYVVNGIVSYEYQLPETIENGTNVSCRYEGTNNYTSCSSNTEKISIPSQLLTVIYPVDLSKTQIEVTSGMAIVPTLDGKEYITNGNLKLTFLSENERTKQTTTINLEEYPEDLHTAFQLKQLKFDNIIIPTPNVKENSQPLIHIINLEGKLSTGESGILLLEEIEDPENIHIEITYTNTLTGKNYAPITGTLNTTTMDITTNYTYNPE